VAALSADAGAALSGRRRHSRRTPARDAASAPAIRNREKSIPLGTSTVIAPGRPPVAAGASVKSRFAIVKITALTKTDRTEPEKGSVGTPAPIFENC
jgi:hypothetical protein